MGRLTVFTTDDCPSCHRVKEAMNKRQIPFVNISLTEYPQKRKDMLSLTDSLTVPQVFLNKTLVGGAEETLRVLKSWENDPELTPLQYYETFVANSPDPVDPRLQPCLDPPTPSPAAPPRERKTLEELPGGTYLTVSAATELLKSIISHKDLKYHLTAYRSSFKGSDAVTALVQYFRLENREEGVAFGRALQRHKILDHVVSEHEFQDADDLFFRLQCYQTPNILNSYRIWTERVDPNSMALLNRLKKQLAEILFRHRDSLGRVNYMEAANDTKLPKFEEAVCELQGVDYENMPYETKVAFSINLYNMMIKYAFVKVGLPTTDVSRYFFFSNVSFYLGPDILSFHDLEHGVLRGNRKPPNKFSPEFGPKDHRLRLAMPKVDCRIHFALSCGSNSCPPVQDFTSDAIEEELRIVALSFCSDNRNVYVDKDLVRLNAIFKWYQEDFGNSNVEMMETIAKFVRGKKKQQIEGLLMKGAFKVKYEKFDWTMDASSYVPFTASAIKPNVSRLIG